MIKTESTKQVQISENVFPLDAHILITENQDVNDLTIMDVSTPGEFKLRHLENAVNIDFFSKSFKSKLSELDTDKTYLVYCKVGGRSKLAQRVMKKVGFRKVYNLTGGTLLWEEEGLPFASGVQGRQLSFCPIFLTIILIRKIKKVLQAGYRLVSNAAVQCKDKAIVAESGSAVNKRCCCSK